MPSASWMRLFRRPRNAEEIRAVYAELYRLACIVPLPLFSRNLDRALLMHAPVLWRSRLLPMLWCCVAGFPLILIGAWWSAASSMPEAGSALAPPINLDQTCLYLAALGGGGWAWAVTRYPEIGGSGRRLRALLCHALALAVLLIPELVTRLAYSYQLATLSTADLPPGDASLETWLALARWHQSLWRSGWHTALRLYDEPVFALLHVPGALLLAIGTSHWSLWLRLRNAWRARSGLRRVQRARAAGAATVATARWWPARADHWLLLHHPASWVAAPIGNGLWLLAMLLLVTAIACINTAEHGGWLNAVGVMTVMICILLSLIALGLDASGTSRAARYPARLQWAGRAYGLDLREFSCALVAGWFAWPALLLLVPLLLMPLIGRTTGGDPTAGQVDFTMVYIGATMLGLACVARLAMLVDGRLALAAVWILAWPLGAIPAGAVALLGIGETRAALVVLLAIYAAGATLLARRSAAHADRVPDRLALEARAWLIAIPGCWVAGQATALFLIAGDTIQLHSRLGVTGYGVAAVASGLLATAMAFGPLCIPALRILVRVNQQPRG